MYKNCILNAKQFLLLLFYVKKIPISFAEKKKKILCFENEQFIFSLKIFYVYYIEIIIAKKKAENYYTIIAVNCFIYNLYCLNCSLN